MSAPQRLTIKELAARLGKPRSYVHAMKRQGFPMPGRQATLAEARAWLAIHPEPRKRKKSNRKSPQETFRDSRNT